MSVLQGEAPPPLSPVLANGAQLMDANLKPTTPEPRGSTTSLDGSEAGSRPASESGEIAAKEAHKKGRFKVLPGACQKSHVLIHMFFVRGPGMTSVGRVYVACQALRRAHTSLCLPSNMKLWACKRALFQSLQSFSPHLHLMAVCDGSVRWAQIVEDDISAEAGKAARRTVTSDKVAEGRGPGSGVSDGGKGPINPTAAKILLPALKELMQGMGTQYDLLKEVVAAVQAMPHLSLSNLERFCAARLPLSLRRNLWLARQSKVSCTKGMGQDSIPGGGSVVSVPTFGMREMGESWGLWWAQDTERGRQASMTTLLAEVSERAHPRPSREEADRLKQEVCSQFPLLCGLTLLPFADRPEDLRHAASCGVACRLLLCLLCVLAQQEHCGHSMIFCDASGRDHVMAPEAPEKLRTENLKGIEDY